MDQPSESQFYFDWAMHEDNLFTNRANFFIVAEAMLLAGIATLLSGDITPARAYMYRIIAVAGIVITSIWLYISVAHLHGTINPIKKRLRELYPQYKEIAERRQKTWLIPTHDCIGIILPIVIVLVWFSLLFKFRV